MKKSFLFVVSVLIYSFFISSCVSKPIPIPGDRKAEINNIYIEYMNIADLYYSEEKFDKAINYYELAMNNKKLYWNCFYKLAKSYVAANEWDKALEYFLILQERDPENNSIKDSIAYIYAMSGKIEQALELYDQLIKLQPENVVYLENYISVILLNEDLATVEAPFMSLRINFPDSKNIETFQHQIDLIIEKKESNNKNTENVEEKQKNKTGMLPILETDFIE